VNDMPEVYQLDTPRARKAHRCCECHGTIQPGETYHRHHGVFDGACFTCAVCVDCDALRDEIEKGRRWDEPVPFDGLHDELIEIEDADRFARFVAIKLRRGAPVPQWMLDRAAKVTP